MAGDSFDNSVGPRRGNPQSSGVANPDRMTDTQKVELILGKGVDPDDMSHTQMATLSSLNDVLTKWTSRALGCADEGVITFSKLASSQRIRSGATVRTSKGDVKVPADKVGKLLDRESKRLLKAEGARLDQTYGAKSNRKVSLFSKYKSVVLALHARAFGAAGDADAQARQQGLTNLKLFLRHGGKLHSTSSGDKLERTIARIPANVLKNASENVNITDYAVAEHLGVGVADHVQGGRKLPLLSFHGFKATRSTFGMGKDSQVYREKLRAITASAHILGGVGKALRVKRLLTMIDSRGVRDEVGGKKEDMVDRILENLGTHCDPDALIDDLEFELKRHDMLKGVRESRHEDAKQLYPEIREKFMELGADPNRATIIENMGYMITEQMKGNENVKGYGFDSPKILHRDLNFMTEKNPIASFMKRHADDADAARTAVAIWVNMMTPADGSDRAKFKIQEERIEYDQDDIDRDETYLDAVHNFGLIDKSKMSAESQSALLRSCLSNPNRPPNWHLEKMGIGKGDKADPNVDHELKFNDDEDFNAGSDTGKIDIETSQIPIRDGGDSGKKANLDNVKPMYKVVDDSDSDNDPPAMGDVKKDV